MITAGNNVEGLNVDAVRAQLLAKLDELKTGKRSGNTEFLQKFWGTPVYDPTNPKRSSCRIMPGRGEEKFWVETHVHKINGHNVHCPKKNGVRSSCPICDYVKMLWNTKDPAKEAIARKIGAKKKFYLNVISRERVIKNEQTQLMEVQTNAGPLILSCGIKVFEKILRDMAKILEEEGINMTGLEQGFDFHVIKEVRGEYPNYDGCETARRPTPAGTPEEIARWKENLNDLTTLVTIKTDDELREEVKKFVSDPTGTGVTAAPVTEAASISTSPVITAPSSVSVSVTPSNDDEEIEDEDFMKNLLSVTKS